MRKQLFDEDFQGKIHALLQTLHTQLDRIDNHEVYDERALMFRFWHIPAPFQKNVSNGVRPKGPFYAHT